MSTLLTTLWSLTCEPDSVTFPRWGMILLPHHPKSCGSISTRSRNGSFKATASAMVMLMTVCSEEGNLYFRERYRYYCGHSIKRAGVVNWWYDCLRFLVGVIVSITRQAQTAKSVFHCTTTGHGEEETQHIPMSVKVWSGCLMIRCWLTDCHTRM